MAVQQLGWAGEMLLRYVELVREEALTIALAFAVGLLVASVFPRMRQGRDRVAGLVVIACLALGLWLAVGKASVFDDAFISFRYVQNLLDGHGLVWNPGERVEGYTNFLWVMILAAAASLFRVELPLLALVLCLASYAGLVMVFAGLERRLFGSGLPLATVLLALQNTSTEYATTGLETCFATLCVVLGLRGLLTGSDRRAAAVSGAWFVLATACRPDHGLFWVAGAATLLSMRLRWERPGRLWGRLPAEDWKILACYGASLLPYLAYLGWKLWYYGEILPNTYYAKGAYSSYFEQGGIYALSFLLAAHAWVIVPIAILGWAKPATEPSWRALKLFALFALPLYNFYVLKVGGDFMVGRFYLVTLPLWLLLARRAVEAPQGARMAGRALLVASLLATLGGVRLLQAPHGRWYLGDESGNYKVLEWYPRVVIRHHNWKGGNNLGAWLQQRGIEPVLATSGIGMVGYYSRLELVDILGLTDRRTARTKLGRRAKPGHEKRASKPYLVRRGVDLVRSTAYTPKRWWKLTEIDIGAHETKHQWHFFRYDRDLVDRIERLAPEIEFTSFERALDMWIWKRRPSDPALLEQDVDFFERYYFAHNDDPRRAAAVAAVLEQARAASEQEDPPAESR